MKPSELKKLARVCREAGIKHYKTAEFEFTLSDEEPIIKTKLKPSPLTKEELEKSIESDDLSEDQMLFWSTGEDYSQESKAS